MVQTIKQKAWYEANKERILLKQKVSRANWTDMDKARTLHNQRVWSKTPNGIRLDRISRWRCLGVIASTQDLRIFYDERYLPATKCEVCENEFKSTRDKHMDHDHDTGEIRYVLCCSCNSHDHWKKVIARKEETIIL